MGIWCIWQSPVYRVLFEPIKAVFLCFWELYNTMKNRWFLLTWEPSKGLARCRNLICVPCYSTQLDWQIPSPRPGSVLNTIHYGAGLPLLSEPGCGPECSVATLCLFSSPPILPWGAAEVTAPEKDFWSLHFLSIWTIFVVELITELWTDKQLKPRWNWWLYPAKRFALQQSLLWLFFKQRVKSHFNPAWSHC